MIGSAFRNVVSLSEIYFRTIRIRKEHIKTQAFPVEGIAPTSAEFRIGRVFDSAVSIIDQIFSISVKICIPEVSSNLDARFFGVDELNVPQPRTFTFGLNLTF